MAEDHSDSDYLGAYSRFFAEFVARMNPYDQLPVSVSSCNVTDAEVVGEIVNVTLQYLNQTQCPASLQAHLVHQVIQEIKMMCKKQPEDCGFKSQERIYTSLKLMQAITGKVNEICTRYLDNSRLALLPPPPCTPLPQVIAGGSKNCRRRMEDRYIVLHNLHTTFSIPDDSIANYYAVFDGHAGQDAAVYCATHLHQYLAESIYYPTDPERALRDAFITTDAQFIEKSKTQKVCGGTTAVCTLLLNKKLYVAWVGDSSAILVKRDSVVQLVSPHRLHREDEVQRIRKMGGVVMRSMGIMRVNGVLSVSRAIGDVRYKPFVTGEPEVRCVHLDGTEDFLVIASDGLTDHLRPDEILTLLYHEIQRNPNDLKRAHQVLLQAAKHAGSEDNITVLVVLLTPAEEIAARPFHCLQVDDILEKMNSKDKPLLLDIDDPHNTINSSIFKQTMINDQSRDHHVDDRILAPSNGKHENGDADYDYSDLGPETDVDAIDDVATMPVKNLSYEFFKENHEEDEDQVDKDSNAEEHVTKDEPQNDTNLQESDENDDDEVRDVHTPDMIRKLVQEEMNEKVTDNVNDQIDDHVYCPEARLEEDDHVNDAKSVDDDAPVDFDVSPPSPQDNKPLQHAVIPEADNVADSEDSEDEWNYYPVDPKKEKDSVEKLAGEPKTKTEQENEEAELPAEHDDLKIQSQNFPEEDIKCESPEKLSPELIDTEISAEDKAEEQPENPSTPEQLQEKHKDMDFQLNPDAEEFIPVSPQFSGTRINLIEDYPISGSPLKQVIQMDDIQVPTQSEFDQEVCQRPREVEAEDKEYQNGEHLQREDYTDFAADRQKILGLQGNLDISEISSTKAEFGDESASFLTATEFLKTDISTIDESFSSEKEYDIAKDPMAMSFTPSDFEAALQNKPVDLNAVHNLSNTDLDDKNCSLNGEYPETRSPEPNLELNTSEIEPSGESTDLLNLSSHQEGNEETFIEHPEESKTVVDLVNLQPEPSQVDQIKSDQSPLTENYSAEYESEKEATSVDNEQPLSPSSVDIDETKPLDETSEEIQDPEVDSQKEVCAKEADTSSSVSPVPENIDEDLADKLDEPEETVESELHADAPEFTPGQYNYYDVGVNAVEETKDTTCQVSVETGDIPESSPIQKEACQAEVEHLRTPDNEQVIRESKQEIVELMSSQENLMDLAKESEVCLKTDEEVEKEPSSPIFVHEPENSCLVSVQESEDSRLISVQESEDSRLISVQESEDSRPISVQESEDSRLISVQESEDSRPISVQQSEDSRPISVQESEDSRLISVQEPEDSGLISVQESAEDSRLISVQEYEDSRLISVQEPEDSRLISVHESEDSRSISVQEPENNRLISVQEPEDSPLVSVQEPEDSRYISVQKAEDNHLSSVQEPQDSHLISEQEPENSHLISVQKPEDSPFISVQKPEDSPFISVQKPEDSPFISVQKPEDSPLISVQSTEEKVPEPMEDLFRPVMSVSEEKHEEIEEEKKVNVEEKLEEIREPVLNLSESMQEFTGLENELKPKQEDEASVSNTAEEPQLEVVQVEKSVVLEKFMEHVVEAVQKPKDAEEKVEKEKILEVKQPEEQKVPEVSETKVSEMGVIAAAVVATTAVGAAAKSKVKLTVTKTTKTTTTKTAPKSTPTSPSKTATKPSSTTTKKPVGSATARPKDLETAKKPPASSATATKPPVAKLAPKTTSVPKSAPKATSNATAKPKLTTSSAKPTLNDKKPTANGDLKSLSKPVPAKTQNKPATTLKSTLVKSTATTKTSSSATTITKPKSASATTTATSKLSLKPTNPSTTTTARPKTAPAAGTVTKSRTSNLTNKPPVIDKQVKETANKQISMSRTSTANSKVAANRLSATNSTTMKRVSTASKNEKAAVSPTKKTITKVSGRTSITRKAPEKPKVLQNGVSEKIQLNNVIEDVPKKDLSPVVGSNDNQLIVSSD